MKTGDFEAEGGCACGAVRYRMVSKPLFVHCCHCRWCQRETGSAFVLNAMIESERIETLIGAPVAVMTPSESGRGQKIMRCPDCQVALWSHYAGIGDKVSFIRVGTLDEPSRVPPDIHIFTSTRLSWVEIPEGAPVYEQYYDWRKEWPEASQARRLAMRKS
ncbi:MAG: GFA family protein [Pseudomonadota bacterium]